MFIRDFQLSLRVVTASYKFSYLHIYTSFFFMSPGDARSRTFKTPTQEYVKQKKLQNKFKQIKRVHAVHFALYLISFTKQWVVSSPGIQDLCIFHFHLKYFWKNFLSSLLNHLYFAYCLLIHLLPFIYPQIHHYHNI